MAIKFCLNVKSLRDQGKMVCLLCNFLSFVAAIQKTHFVCKVDVCSLFFDFIVYSAYGVQSAREVSLLIKCFLDARVDLVQLAQKVS